MQELSENLLVSTQEIDEKTSALTQAMHEMQEMEQQLEQEKAEKRKSGSSIKDLNAKCTELERKLDERTRAAQRVEERYNDLKSTCAESEARVARRDAKIEKLAEKNEKFSRECSFLMDEVKTLAYMAGKNKSFVARVDKDGKLCTESAEDNQGRRSSSGLVNAAVDSLRAELEAEKGARIKLQEEIKKLRQKVVYTEERRKSDLHRQMQIVRGKEQESEYIWQKYVDAVRESPRRPR